MRTSADEERKNETTAGVNVSRRGFIAAAVTAGFSVFSNINFAYAEEDSETQTREIIDSLGRVVEIPLEIERVVPVRPNAQAFLTALCPDKVAALCYEPKGEEERATSGRNLPVAGRIPHLSEDEVAQLVDEAKPDLFVDVGKPDGSKTDAVRTLQEKTDVPVVSVEMDLSCTGDVFRALDLLLGTTRGENLATYIETSLADVEQLADSHTDSQNKRILFCEEELSFAFGVGERDVQRQIISFVRGEDAYPEVSGPYTYGLKISPSLLAPDIIIVPDQQTHDLLLDEEDLRSAPPGN